MLQASFWAANPNAVALLLAETNPKYIWMSLGGDDILGSFLAQKSNFTAINEQVPSPILAIWNAGF